jgi:hypothetical protein
MKPPANETPTATEAPTAVESSIDLLFEGYARELPAPVNLSEQNGASTTCADHRGATYSLLQATAERIPIRSDADLASLAK